MIKTQKHKMNDKGQWQWIAIKGDSFYIWQEVYGLCQYSAITGEFEDEPNPEDVPDITKALEEVEANEPSTYTETPLMYELFRRCDDDYISEPVPDWALESVDALTEWMKTQHGTVIDKRRTKEEHREWIRSKK